MHKKIAIDINDTLRDNITQLINVYKKFFDTEFSKKIEDFDEFDFYESLDFENRDEYNKFRYIDYAFELYGRAEPVERMLPYNLNNWITNTLGDFEEDDIPELMFVSPFESGLSIQATLSFLSKMSSRVREYYFPIDSMTIWDKCDILITANPNLILNKPEKKSCIKIEMPYNKDTKCDYSFKSLTELINDEKDTIIDLIEKE